MESRWLTFIGKVALERVFSSQTAVLKYVDIYMHDTTELDIIIVRVGSFLQPKLESTYHRQNLLASSWLGTLSNFRPLLNRSTSLVLAETLHSLTRQS
jgi:hypothetical protein